MASSSSSHGNTNSHVYEVFLNHRGPDQKKRLASHIYRRLIVRGLNVFLDQPELEKGEALLPQIKEAIRTASVHVALFSPTYAQSTWCLEELALMVESGSAIIPVFIDVDPSELRWTRCGDGRYARNLQELENKTTLDPDINEEKPRHDSTTLKRWKDALYVVSNQSGFVMDAYNGDEGLLVDAVVEEVCRNVRKTPLNVAKYPTGLDEKIERVERMVLLQHQTQKSMVVGIVGLGGVGKSTLAKQFFNRHTSNYDRYCFLSDVRETAAKNSLSSLQTTLLMDLKNWLKGFEKLVEEFLDFCDGLPLSLKVIGAAILGKDVEVWKSQLEKNSRILHKDSHSKLKISYDGLDEEEQNIFLDVACFFIGENKDTAIRRWNGSGWAGWLGLRNLENRCLVEVDSEDCIRMHDHLRDLGRDVAEKEHPGCQLRLSRPNVNLLRTLSGLSHLQVRGISMDYGNGREQFFENVADNCNLSSLELLRGEGSFVERVFNAGELQQLIYLRWKNCPISSIRLPIITRNLRVLYIQGRNLRTLWQHESEAPLQLRELYIDAPISEVPESIGKLNQLEKIVLKNSVFETLPNVFHEMLCLKYIILNSCSEMMLLPDSVGQLTGLQTLDFHECFSLQGLPDSVGQLTGLQSIDLWECFSLQGLPDSVGQLTSLQSIYLDECSNLQGLSDSVGQLTGLQSIYLNGCSSLQGLPDSVGQLMGLQTLDLNGCSSLQGLPDSVGQLTGL